MSRAPVVIACVILFDACSAPAPAAVRQSPTESSVASPAPTPSAQLSASATPGTGPAESPSVAADLPLTTAAFNCRLPELTESGTGGTNWIGGFVTFPEATYRSDPGGLLINTPDGEMATQAQPVLRGVPQTGGPFYDLAMKRWLPVGPGQTSPDGTSYAYAVSGQTSSDPTEVHIVTVATGADRVIKVTPTATGAAVGWTVGDFDGRYAYLLSQQFEEFPLGVWRVDVTTGTLSQISQSGSIILLQNGNMWIGVVNPADPSPPRPPRSGQYFDSLAEVNLATGAQTMWIYRAGKAIFLLGVDGNGHPVVTISDAPGFNIALGDVFVVSSPGDTGKLVSHGDLPFPQMQADSTRLWFGTERGIYLWTNAGGLQKVFASSQPVTVAGRCV